MQWYYSKNGTQLGPVSEGEIIAKLASGEVSAADLVWKEGMADWRPAASVAELASLRVIPPVVNSPVVNSPYAPPTFPSAPMPGGANIPNYLWQSIVVTIFCCWPLGIPAIVYAAKVDGLRARGDIAGAMAASSSAKTWCIVAAGIWLGLVVLWILFAGFAAVFSQ
jgi:hypothetical protein